MFVAGARLTVPVCAVVLRKAYGLGAMAMAAGDLRRPAITVAWPTGEFGGMGLEGAVRLDTAGNSARSRTPRPARHATTSWSPSSTPGARRSAPPPRSRSTT
jgi:acetyl-CoA carboxylase carboxyltransferase component